MAESKTLGIILEFPNSSIQFLLGLPAKYTQDWTTFLTCFATITVQATIVPSLDNCSRVWISLLASPCALPWSPLCRAVRGIFMKRKLHLVTVLLTASRVLGVMTQALCARSCLPVWPHLLWCFRGPHWLCCCCARPNVTAFELVSFNPGCSCPRLSYSFLLLISQVFAQVLFPHQGFPWTFYQK